MSTRASFQDFIRFIWIFTGKHHYVNKSLTKVKICKKRHKKILENAFKIQKIKNIVA